MSNPKQVKKSATVLIGITVVILLLFIVQEARTIILSMGGYQWRTVSLAGYIAMILFVFVSLAMSMSLLYSIKQDASPFSYKNVKKLKIIAVLLIAFEPLHYLSQWVFNRLFPTFIEGAELIIHTSLGDATPIADATAVMVASYTTLGGVVLAAGLIVYCVALVFQYGISLQNQVDETL